jgi:protein-L-isoaspartate(D-aspartate) O-methyltransferase
MVAILLSQASPQPGMNCLEIGAGSGWLAVLAGELVGREGHVTGVEIVPDLVELARSNVRASGLNNVDIVETDGSTGYPPRAPYDVIVVSCAAPSVPEPLLDQLEIGGRLVVPVGKQVQQQLLRITRTAEGYERDDLGGCAFVPLVGDEGFDNPNR